MLNRIVLAHFRAAGVRPTWWATSPTTTYALVVTAAESRWATINTGVLCALSDRRQMVESKQLVRAHSRGSNKMTGRPNLTVGKAELDRLTADFFDAVSFEEGGTPPYDNIYVLFIEGGLLVKSANSAPEVSTVNQFIEPRREMVRSGELTRFAEMELCEFTEIFGNVAHRFSSYAKSGIMKGVPIAARGMISTQFVRTPEGWKISAMAWDDERPGLSIPERYEPTGLEKL